MTNHGATWKLMSGSYSPCVRCLCIPAVRFPNIRPSGWARRAMKLNTVGVRTAAPELLVPATTGAAARDRTPLATSAGRAMGLLE